MVVPYNPDGVVNMVILVTARASGLLKQMGMIRDAMARGSASWRIAGPIQQHPDYPFETVYGLRDYRLDAETSGERRSTSGGPICPTREAGRFWPPSASLSA